MAAVPISLPATTCIVGRVQRRDRSISTRPGQVLSGIMRNHEGVPRYSPVCLVDDRTSPEHAGSDARSSHGHPLRQQPVQRFRNQRVLPPQHAERHARSDQYRDALARRLLEEPLPRRWSHTQGVAAAARTLAPILGGHAGLPVAAAWLHDIGYTPALVVTGFHPLDGARYLRDTHLLDNLLCVLVALTPAHSSVPPSRAYLTPWLASSPHRRSTCSTLSPIAT